MDNIVNQIIEKIQANLYTNKENLITGNILANVLEFITESLVYYINDSIIDSGGMLEKDIEDLIDSKLEPYDTNIRNINASIKVMQDKMNLISNKNLSILNDILENSFIIDPSYGTQSILDNEGFVNIVSKYNLTNNSGTCFPCLFKINKSDNYRYGTLLFTNIPEYNLQRLDISIKSEVFEFNPFNNDGSLNQEVLFSPIDLGNTKTYAWLYNTSKNILLYLSSNISQETKEEFL